MGLLYITWQCVACKFPQAPSATAYRGTQRFAVTIDDKNLSNRIQWLIAGLWPFLLHLQMPTCQEPKWRFNLSTFMKKTDIHMFAPHHHLLLNGKLLKLTNLVSIVMAGLHWCEIKFATGRICSVVWDIATFEFSNVAIKIDPHRKSKARYTLYDRCILYAGTRIFHALVMWWI